MWNKVFITILSIFGICFWWWYTLVYSNFYRNLEINFLWVSSPKVYINSDTLNHIKVYFHSTEDIHNYKLSWACQGTSKFVSQKDSVYVFDYALFDINCTNTNFYLVTSDNKTLTNTLFTLNVQRDFDLYNTYLDFDDTTLRKALEKVKQLQKKYTLFSNVKDNGANKDFAKKSFYFDELAYNEKIIKTIIEGRKTKYLIPVGGFELPDKNLNKFPNGGRPYRAAYTDWVHEGWDIDAPYGTEVRSLDAGVIVKVVRNFEFSDLNTIKMNGTLSDQDKAVNLDILRGNQVWVKTMKWDVVFYAHLSKIYDDIQVGNIVPRGYPLGKVGKSWVPDKDYTDYHLHFEVRKNPYMVSEAGKYSLYDYLNWDWYFRGQSREYVRAHQYEVFEK